MRSHFLGVMVILLAAVVVVSLVTAVGTDRGKSHATVTTSPTTTVASAPPKGGTYWLLYALPFVAFVSRPVLWFTFIDDVGYRQSGTERDENSHRSTILAISGFSVTVFMGLSVVEAAVQKGFGLAAYYSGISFVFFLAAYVVQGFKWTFLIDQVGDTCLETGMAGLVASVIAVELAVFGLTPPSLIVACLGVIVWLLHHVTTMSLMWQYLAARRRARHAAA